MASSHNNGPPPINYATHPKRRQLLSREATPAAPISTPLAMASSDNNGPPPINYTTHPKRHQLLSREATPVTQISTPLPSPTKPKHGQPVAALPSSTYSSHLFMYAEPQPQPPARSSHFFLYEEPHPQPPARPSNLFIYEEPLPQPPARSSHRFIYEELPAHVDSRFDVTEAHLDGLADALEGLSIGSTHNAPLASTTASAYGLAHAPLPPPSVTRVLPVPFAHVTPGRKTNKKFYSVTVGKCCGVFNNWNFVTTIVSGVSGSSFKGFKSYQDAIEDYDEAKSRGSV